MGVVLGVSAVCWGSQLCAGGAVGVREWYQGHTHNTHTHLFVVSGGEGRTNGMHSRDPLGIPSRTSGKWSKNSLY